MGNRAPAADLPSRVSSLRPAPVQLLQDIPPCLKQSFHDCLRSMDESMFLLQYHDEIAANFDSLEQIHEIYFRAGELKATFFEDVGIKKLGHRRIIQKWF